MTTCEMVLIEIPAPVNRPKIANSEVRPRQTPIRKRVTKKQKTPQDRFQRRRRDAPHLRHQQLRKLSTGTNVFGEEN